MNRQSVNAWLIQYSRVSKFSIPHSVLIHLREVVLLCKREFQRDERMNIRVKGPVNNCLFKEFKHEVIILIFENPNVNSRERIVRLQISAMKQGFDLCSVRSSVEPIDETYDFHTMNFKVNIDFQESCGRLGDFTYRSYIGRNSALMYRLLMEPSKSWRHTYYEMKLLGAACDGFQEEDFNRGLTYILENSIRTSHTMQEIAPIPEESFIQEAEAHYQQLAERADAILTDRKSLDWPEIFEKYERT